MGGAKPYSLYYVPTAVRKGARTATRYVRLFVFTWTMVRMLGQRPADPLAKVLTTLLNLPVRAR